MHGTYAHRITCNLHTSDYYRLEEAARKFRMRLAPFVRDSALAYIDQKNLIPVALSEEIHRVHQEIRRISNSLNQIAARGNTLQRLTHRDLQDANNLVLNLEDQLMACCRAFQNIPS